MRRYEVWQLKPAPGRATLEIVMILQSEKIDHLPSIIVAPLQPKRSDLIVPSLTPSIDLGNVRYTILVPLMTAIDRRDFDFRLVDGSAVSYEIDRSIDRLFMGI